MVVRLPGIETATPPLRRRLLVIGIGAGHPDYVTVQAIDALNRADVFFIPDKGAEPADLARIRREICGRFIADPAYRIVDFAMPRRARDGDYKAGVARWHDEIEARFATLIAEELSEDQCGAFLVWGDPSLYDSTLRILKRLETSGRFAIDTEVIPGITAPQALAARHKIALNAIGRSVLLAPGRALVEGFPNNADGIVVMLDGSAALRTADGDLDIYWGANIGTPDEVLVSGRLRDVIDEIERVRSRVRSDKGWIMETSLLRRPDDEGPEEA